MTTEPANPPGSQAGAPEVARPAKVARSRSVIVAAVVAVVLLGGFVALAVSRANVATRQINLSSGPVQLLTYSPSHEVTTSATTLQRLGGGAPITVGGATGAPMVVNFFASWCPACQKELGSDAAVAKTGGVRFIGVDTDDTQPQTALALLHKAGATYPVGIGQAGLAESYGTGNLPTTAFIDGKGKIVALALGAIPHGELARWVKDLALGRALSSASS